MTLHAPPPSLADELSSLLDEWEAGLQNIDYPEVTDEDRITFLEHVVSWQVRRALRAGRFDLALALRAGAARRVAELLEQRSGWRPVLLYGVSVSAPGRRPGRLTSSPSART